jgi:hypothetical protein
MVMVCLVFENRISLSTMGTVVYVGSLTWPTHGPSGVNSATYRQVELP